MPWSPAAAAAEAALPLEAIFSGPLEAGKLHLGDLVLLRVALPWSDGGCTLQAGSVVQGRVVEVTRHSKTERDGSVEILFSSADCNGHPETPRALVLAALIGVSRTAFADANGGVPEAPPLASATGIAIGGSGAGTNGLRSVAAASERTYTTVPMSPDQTIWKPGGKMPSHVLPGDVIAIPKHHLRVGAGKDGATVIWGDARDVKLDRGTVAILVAVPAAAEKPPDEAHAAAPVAPASDTATEVAGRPATGGEPAAVAPGPEPPDETDVCSSDCTAVLPAETPAAPAVSAAVFRLPLRSFGYLPHERHRGTGFDAETTLTWLDVHHLLCTFDPHHLRQRTGPDDDAVRTVRAVLIDPATRRTRRVLDWRVRGDGQYLWRFGRGGVLVRMDRELRLLSAELRPLGSLPLHGRVAWIVASPGGDHLAVGTIHELHSSAEHKELERVLALEPEEQVVVDVYAAGFRRVLETTRSSRSPDPVLDDAGELRVAEGTDNRWRISQAGWDGTDHQLAMVRSLCRPVLSTPEHGLIFAVGCTLSGGRWYRMLRSDGHLLLKADSPSDEIEQTALAPADAGAFAVRVVKTVRPMTYGQSFARADLLREQLALYRSTDGAKMGALTTEDFAPSEEAFALSPDGRDVALAGRAAIQIFALHR